jgi:hypothetical protein
MPLERGKMPLYFFGGRLPFNNRLAHIFSNHEPSARRPHRVAHQLALKEIAIPLLSLLPCGMFGVQFIMGNRVAIS